MSLVTSSIRARVSGGRPDNRLSSRRNSARRMSSNRCRSATTVGIARRDRCHAVNRDELLVDDGLGARDLGPASRQVLLHDALQVIDVVQEDLFDLADRRVDVAWHGDVDDEQRFGAPPAQDHLDVLAHDDGSLRSRRREDDVRVAHRLSQARPGNRASADLRRERVSVPCRATRNDDLLHAVAAQVLRGQRADLAGADDEHAPAVETAENLSRQRHCGEAHRHGAFAERRFAAHALSDAERPVKRLVQERSRAASFRRGLEGALYLTEDLRFAHDERIESRRHPKQVPRGRDVVVHEQVGPEHLARKLMVVAEEATTS